VFFYVDKIEGIGFVFSSLGGESAYSPASNYSQKAAFTNS
jgi:hypothetical protein